MRKQYELTTEEAAEAIGLKGVDQITSFWKKVGEKYRFNAKTIKFLSPTQFEADEIIELVEQDTHDYNAYGKRYAAVITGDPEGDMKAKIAEYKNKFVALTVVDENDKVGYATVKAGISEIRSIRSRVEETRKELKKDPLELGRKIDSTAKNIVDELLPIEEKLKEQIERIDAIKEKQREEKQLALEKKFNERIGLLLKNGMTFTGMGYKLNDLLITTVEIKALPEKDWNEFVLKVGNEWTQEQQRVLAAQKEEEERLKAEAEQKIFEERKRVLLNVGFYEHDGNYTRITTSKKHQAISQSVTFVVADLKAQTNEQFDIILRGAYADIESTKLEIREAQEKIAQQEEAQRQEALRLKQQKEQQDQQRKAQRITALNQLGYLFNGTNFVRNEKFGLTASVPGSVLEDTDENWKESLRKAEGMSVEIDVSLKEKQEQEKQAQLDEAKRIAEKAAKDKAEAEERAAKLLPVKEQLLMFADQLENTRYPDISDESATKIVASAISKIVGIAGEVREAAENL